MPLGAFKAALMGTAGVSAGADVVLLHDTDYSNASAAAITSGIDSTYGEYIFSFYNINPASDVVFQFNGSIDGGSNYNVAKTSTLFRANHEESNANAVLAYAADNDEAQGTGYQDFVPQVSSGTDENCAGTLHLFNPSSTTYVKHFYSRIDTVYASTYDMDCFAAGYFNTTSAINAIDFKMSSGNFDGTIKMWGVK